MSSGTTSERTAGMCRWYTAAALGALVCVACAPTPDDGGATRGWSTEHVQELLAMAAKDQDVRAGLNTDTGMDTAFLLRIARTDSANTRRLHTLIDSLGWPDAAAVGLASLEAAFLVVQHSTDAEFQLAMLPHVEADVQARRLNPQDYALLIDRTRQKRGQLQLYGTQLSGQPGSRTVTLDPIEDSVAVNARRESLGLPSLEQYLDGIEAGLGLDVAGHPRKQ